MFIINVYKNLKLGYFYLDKSLFDMGDKWFALKNNMINFF